MDAKFKNIQLINLEQKHKFKEEQEPFKKNTSIFSAPNPDLVPKYTGSKITIWWKFFIVKRKQNIRKYQDVIYNLYRRWKNSFTAIFTTCLLINIIIIGYLVLTKGQYITDFFKLKKIQNPQSFFDLIIGSLSSLSGILIAVLLIAFQILKGKLGRNAQKYFFSNKQLMFITILFTINILTAFLSKILILDIPTNNILNLLYFNAILFIISLITIIPLTVSVLFSLDITKVIDSEIKKISYDEIYFFSVIPEFATGLEFDLQKEKFPINILTEIAVKNVRDNYVISKVISRGGILKLMDILKGRVDSEGRINMYEFTDHKNGYGTRRRLDYFKAYINLLQSIYREAIKIDSRELLESINFDLYYLLGTSLEYRIHPIELQGVHHFIDKYFYDLIKHGYKDLVLNLASILEKIAIESLEKIAPKESQIQEIYRFHKLGDAPDKNDEAGVIWRLIQDYFITFFSRLLRYSLELKKQSSFDTISSFYSSIIHDLRRLENLGEYQKHDLILRIQSDLGYNLKKGLENNRFSKKSHFSTDRMYGHFIIEMIKSDHQFLREYLLNTGNFIVDVAKMGKLSYFDIQRFTNYGHHAIEGYQKSKKLKQTFFYILNILKVLKVHLEKDLKGKEYEYKFLKNRIKAYRKYAKEQQLKKPLKRIKKLYKSFKPIPKSEWKDGHGYVPWKNKIQPTEKSP